MGLKVIGTILDWLGFGGKCAIGGGFLVWVYFQPWGIPLIRGILQGTISLFQWILAHI